MQSENKHYTTVLTIAGSDSGGGAGIQADLKTFSALGAYGTSCITAITAQNTLGVTAIQPIERNIVRAQLDAVFSDLKPIALKTGMLHNREIVEEVIHAIECYSPQYMVIDPVMVSTSGSNLIDPSAIEFLADKLFPKATLITPNIKETEVLSGIKVTDEESMLKAAKWFIQNTDIQAVLLKGGDLCNKESVDFLVSRKGKEIRRFAMPYVQTRNNHGTGCTLSAAITVYLAYGYPLQTAILNAKRYLHRALEAGAQVETGKGNGSVNHFFAPKKLKLSEEG
ncbi:MAG: bifunctional hydroxymethylpyrimidine kinase/phosphomethylpyrimidine kinase [Bacteroidales bacterium]|nr:bifunctional hydroxymethylpyrimidine kinase/phosphomethylpyrimidine kinase [Bacteroidales bacterium]